MLWSKEELPVEIGFLNQIVVSYRNLKDKIIST